MVTVTCFKYKGSRPSGDFLDDLEGVVQLEHKCPSPECALEVVRDLVSAAERDMVSERIHTYSLHVERSKGS